MGVLILFGAGFLIGLKTSLLAQFLIVVAFTVFMLYLAGRDVGEIFVQAIIVWVVGVFLFSIAIGDLYYYVHYYQGTTTISDFFGWFLKP